MPCSYPAMRLCPMAAARGTAHNPFMDTQKPISEDYAPPDFSQIESDPVAIDYWARSLNVDQDALRKAVQRVGPELETVKKELGIGGVG
jgi:hypothetical protein